MTLNDYQTAVIRILRKLSQHDTIVLGTIQLVKLAKTKDDIRPVLEFMGMVPARTPQLV